MQLSHFVANLPLVSCDPLFYYARRQVLYGPKGAAKCRNQKSPGTARILLKLAPAESIGGAPAVVQKSSPFAIAAIKGPNFHP